MAGPVWTRAVAPCREKLQADKQHEHTIRIETYLGNLDLLLFFIYKNLTNGISNRHRKVNVSMKLMCIATGILPPTTIYKIVKLFLLIYKIAF